MNFKTLTTLMLCITLTACGGGDSSEQPKPESDKTAKPKPKPEPDKTTKPKPKPEPDKTTKPKPKPEPDKTAKPKPKPETDKTTKPTIKPLAFNFRTISPSTTDKAATFTWDRSGNAIDYLLCKRDASKPKSCDKLATTKSTSVTINDFGVISNLNSEYFVIAKNSYGEKESNFKQLTPKELSSFIQYIKASNTGAEDIFGASVSLSLDGNTLAVGSPYEDSDGLGDNNDSKDSGAVYIFRYQDKWTQEAKLKAPKVKSDDNFGISVALSSNGNTLAVGANDDYRKSGAVYVFRYNESKWNHTGYIKGSEPESDDRFGLSISLSSDGNTLAAGAYNDSSSGTGVNPDLSGVATISFDSGAAYIYRYKSDSWVKEAYLKASNTGELDHFGISVSLSFDGNTLAVGASGEDSDGRGINPKNKGSNDDAKDSGAVYIFRYTSEQWAQEAYVKASNTGKNDDFGGEVVLSPDGSTLAVGAAGERSNGVGVNPTDKESNDDYRQAGAVYIFRYFASDWSQQAYIKSINSGINDSFGSSIALSHNGNTLAIGSSSESEGGLGVNPIDWDEIDFSSSSGAVYLLRYSSSTWSHEAYIKAPNTGDNDIFGTSVTISSDGNRLAVGSSLEDSDGVGVNPDSHDNNDINNSGAIYIY